MRVEFPMDVFPKSNRHRCFVGHEMAFYGRQAVFRVIYDLQTSFRVIKTGIATVKLIYVSTAIKRCCKVMLGFGQF